MTRRETRSTDEQPSYRHQVFVRFLSVIFLAFSSARCEWMMGVHQYFFYRHHSLRLSSEGRTNDRLLQCDYWTIIHWSSLEHHRESIDIFLIIIGQLDRFEHSTACSCHRTSLRFTLVHAMNGVKKGIQHHVPCRCLQVVKPIWRHALFFSFLWWTRLLFLCSSSHLYTPGPKECLYNLDHSRGFNSDGRIVPRSTASQMFCYHWIEKVVTVRGDYY